MIDDFSEFLHHSSVACTLRDSTLLCMEFINVFNLTVWSARRVVVHCAVFAFVFELLCVVDKISYLITTFMLLHRNNMECEFSHVCLTLVGVKLDRKYRKHMRAIE